MKWYPGPVPSLPQACTVLTIPSQPLYSGWSKGHGQVSMNWSHCFSAESDESRNSISSFTPFSRWLVLVLPFSYLLPGFQQAVLFVFIRQNECFIAIVWNFLHSLLQKKYVCQMRLSSCTELSNVQLPEVQWRCSQHLDLVFLSKPPKILLTIYLPHNHVAFAVDWLVTSYSAFQTVSFTEVFLYFHFICTGVSPRDFPPGLWILIFTCRIL